MFPFDDVIMVCVIKRTDCGDDISITLSREWHRFDEIVVAGCTRSCQLDNFCPDNKVHGANMGPIWGRQDPGGPLLAPWTLLSGWCNQWRQFHRHDIVDYQVHDEQKSNLWHNSFDIITLCVPMWRDVTIIKALDWIPYFQDNLDKTFESKV